MIDGFFNVYKEKGYTSHDVVAIIRKLTGMKTGHTGTLDPDAEGVLPICIGKATKLSEQISSSDKQYLCTAKLGITTDTQDASGAIISEAEVTAGEDDIRAAVMSFLGEYYQMPPMYSAVKIGGKKLYELARKGKEVEREKRLVYIHAIEILEIVMPGMVKIAGQARNDANEYTIKMIVDCSKGTYIRTLCNDIGDVLGCGGHMASLVRTKAGGFDVHDSVKLEVLKQAKAGEELEKFIIPL